MSHPFDIEIKGNIATRLKAYCGYSIDCMTDEGYADLRRCYSKQ